MKSARAIGTLFLVATACEVDEVRQIRAAAAKNFDCAPEHIEIRKMKEQDDGDVYEASGCGVPTRYYFCEAEREQVAGRDRAGARGNMRTLIQCREMR